MKKQTFKHGPFIYVIVAAIYGGTLGGVAWMGLFETPALYAYVFGPLFLIAAGACAALYRIAIAVDDQGVTVTGLFGTRRYAWEKLKSITERGGTGSPTSARVKECLISDTHNRKVFSFTDNFARYDELRDLFKSRLREASRERRRKKKC